MEPEAHKPAATPSVEVTQAPPLEEPPTEVPPEELPAEEPAEAEEAAKAEEAAEGEVEPEEPAKEMKGSGEENHLLEAGSPDRDLEAWGLNSVSTVLFGAIFLKCATSLELICCFSCMR